MSMTLMPCNGPMATFTPGLLWGQVTAAPTRDQGRRTYGGMRFGRFVPRMLRSAPRLRRGALLIRGLAAPRAWVPARRSGIACRNASGTREQASAFSRHEMPESCVKRTLWKSEGAGKTGCWLHPRPACNKKRRRQVPQVQPERPGLPCAMVLRLIRDLPGVPGLLASVPRALERQGLIPASGDQDHTISPSAPASRVNRCQGVHRIPPDVRDDAYAPPFRGGMGIDNHIFPKNGR